MTKNIEKSKKKFEILYKLSDTSREGRTSLDIAREEGFDRIVAMLLEKEFKDGFSNLPSPPPTPPSAPELELFETNSEISIEREDREETREMKPNSVNTFDRCSSNKRGGENVSPLKGIASVIPSGPPCEDGNV